MDQSMDCDYFLGWDENEVGSAPPLIRRPLMRSHGLSNRLFFVVIVLLLMMMVLLACTFDGMKKVIFYFFDLAP